MQEYTNSNPNQAKYVILLCNARILLQLSKEFFEYPLGYPECSICSSDEHNIFCAIDSTWSTSYTSVDRGCAALGCSKAEKDPLRHYSESGLTSGSGTPMLKIDNI